MKRSIIAVAIFICTFFFSNLCPSTYNHAQLAQLLKKLNATHELSQNLKGDLSKEGHGPTTEKKPHITTKPSPEVLKEVERKNPDDFQGRLDACLKILSQYDNLWEHLRDVLGLPKDGDLVDAVATVIDQVLLARSLLSNLADYAEENKES